MKKLRLSKLLILLVSICLMTTIYSYALTTDEVLGTTEVSVRVAYTKEYRRELAKEGMFLGSSETSIKIPASYFKNYEEDVTYYINNNDGNVSARWKSVGIVKLRNVLPDASKEQIVEAIAISNESREGIVTLVRSYMLGLATCSIIILVMQRRLCIEIEKSTSKGDRDS